MPERSGGFGSGAFWTGVVVDSRDVEAMLARAASAVSGPSLALFMRASADPYLRRRAQERFASEGDAAVGGGWRPLRESTAQIRTELGYRPRHPINRRTGELEEFITGGVGSVVSEPQGAMLTRPARQPAGEVRDKLETAQRGRDDPHTLPRPVLGLDTIDLQAVMVSLEAHITKSMLVGSVG